MKFVLLSIFWLLLGGCGSNKTVDQRGPLSQVRDFSVFAFFSPYEQFDRNALFNVLIDNLKDIGHVEVIDKVILSKHPAMSTLLFLSLGGYQQEYEGSIKVIGSVEIEANKFKMECPIWHTNFKEPAENLPYPIIENGKVAFRKDVTEPSLAPQKKSDPIFILTQLVAEFAKEYYSFNSAKERPVFHVYVQEL